MNASASRLAVRVPDVSIGSSVTDFSDCPTCGEWRDNPQADCANCGYHEHRVSEERDRGGAMDGTCLDCGLAIVRDSYGSFVGPWRGTA